MGEIRSFSLVSADSNQGPSRTANEDAYWTPDANTPVSLGNLYLVADGVGGQQAGELASQIAVAVARDAFYTARQKGLPVSKALVQAIRQANEAVYDEGQKRNGRMGSTIVAAVHEDSRLHVAHVGDARAYLVRGTALQRLTRDDTWVQKQVDAGLLTPDEAAQHELRHVVTQALGNKPDVEVHLAPDFPLEPGDVFLLCSDGLYDSISEAQLYHLLREYPTTEAAAVLIQEAIRANAADNITAVVVQAGWQPVVPAADPEATMAAGPAPNTLATAALTTTRTNATSSRPSSPPRRKVPGWLLTTILSVVVLLVVVGLFVGLALRQNGDITPGTATALPTLTEPPPLATAAALSTVLPTSQPTSLPAVLPTATFSATTAVVLPVITVTLQSTATAVNLACVEAGNQLFVWDDQQINAGNCTQVVQREAFVLQPNQQVQILSEEIRSVTGPDAGCQTNELIRIRSADNPEVEGWVLANGLRRISPEESCGP